MKNEKKEKAPPAKFWRELVQVFFDFVAEKFSGAKPSFDGSSPKDLKGIVTELEKRATESGVGWTEQEAKERLRNFLTVAYSITWLRENFLLFNLNRQKDKIFFTKKINNNGTEYAGITTHSNQRVTKSTGAEKLLAKLAEEIRVDAGRNPDH